MKPGYYWIQFKEPEGPDGKGDVTIGHYNPHGPHDRWPWDVIGSDEGYEEREVTVLSEEIIR